MAGALVGGAVLSALLQVLFDRLASRGLIDCVWRRKDDDVLLKKLKASLVFAEVVLSDAEHKQINDLTAKGWLYQLEETVADAQNLLNGIDNRDSPRRLTGGLRSKLLEDMLDRLELMARQKDAFGFIELEVQPSQEPNICGRDEDMEAIVSLLLSDDVPGDPICVITIVGVPGIGKTMLAQSLYNNNRVEGEELIGRKLLLVLDDLCTEDCSEWNTLRSPRRFCTLASKTIVTARSEITAAMTCMLPAYHLSPLPYEDCWLIFAQHAFDSGLGAPEPNLEALGREVAKKCGGLPLVAKTLGVLFRSKPNHGEWNEILKDSTWDASHDLSSFVQTLSITSGIGKWRRKPLESQHDENFFPGVLNQFGGTYPYVKIKRAWLSILLVLWIVILSIASALIYKTVRDYQITKMEEALGSMCDKWARMIPDQFTVNVNHIHMLAEEARFYHQQNATFTEQMREALGTYVDNATFQRPLLSGVAFAEREGHCEKENSNRGEKWKIMDMTFIKPPSPIQACTHFCEANTASVDALLNSLGTRIRKEDQDHVLKGRAYEKAVLSGPFRLLPSNWTGVIMTYPVYGSTLSPSMRLENNTVATAGYIGGLVKFESFVEYVLRQLGNQTVLVTIYDITNSSRSLMYGHNYVESDRTMMHKSRLELGDPFRKYLMICRYRDAPSLSWSTAIVAVSTFTIGSLVTCLLYAAAVHSVKIRQGTLRIRGLEVQLQDANTANSQLRADASEIKQPAYIIIKTLAMLLETELSSIQRGYIQIARACGRRQIALVDKALESPNLPVITHNI